MTDKNTGGSAFPSHGSMGEVAQDGMTLRDYFATKAMQGFCTKSSDVNGIVRTAYQVADAMLEARKA